LMGLAIFVLASCCYSTVGLQGSYSTCGGTGSAERAELALRSRDLAAGMRTYHVRSKHASMRHGSLGPVRLLSSLLAGMRSDSGAR